jgi:SAM-dependent methyltransferase
MGCTDEPFEDDICLDMKWSIDKESGMIQLMDLVPLDILYSRQHMDSTGSTWNEYNDLLASFISNEIDGDIIEIGGGSGKLAIKVLEILKNKISYTIVEPNPLISESKNIKIIKDFFSSNIDNPLNKVRTVVLSQVLEHAYNPEEFLLEIRKYLPENGKFVFGYPNLEYFFSNKHTNAINFEHTLLMTDYFVEYFLKKTGFKLLKKQNFKNHSFFYSVQKSAIHQISQPDSRNYKKFKLMFNEFINYHKNMIRELNHEIINHNGEIFLFGAHIFSQYLIGFGLSTKKINSILDNSPIKIGKRLYGTKLMVQSPKCLSKSINPLVILKAGVYNEEIKTDILTKINSETKFI